MNSQDLFLAMDTLLDIGLVPNVIGHRGEGKTTTIQEYAVSRGYNYLNLRPAQASDAGDILGLAETVEIEGKRYSKFVQHHFLPNSGKWIIFLDEINRATKDILQPIFELILEKKISLNGYCLPEESRIITAMNPPTEDYDVTLFEDSAFWDRFCHINFENTHEDWQNYIKNKYGNTTYANFIKLNQSSLTTQLSVFDVSTLAKPSKRSGEFVVQLEIAAKKRELNDNILYELIEGLVGRDNSIAYKKYVKENCVPISFNNFKKDYSLVKDKIQKAVEDDRIDVLDKLSGEIIDYYKKRKDPVTENMASSLVSYIVDLPVNMGHYLARKLAVTQNEDGTCMFSKTVGDNDYGVFTTKTEYGKRFNDYVDSIHKNIKDLIKMYDEKEKKLAEETQAEV